MDCTETPSEQVLTTHAAWQAWWTVHTDCLRSGQHVDPPPGTGSGESEPGGGIVDPGIPYDPYPVEAPEVNFEDYVVVAISLAESEGYWRSVWVQDVETTDTGTTVHYEVSTPGEDCFGVFADGREGEPNGDPDGGPGEEPGGEPEPTDPPEIAPFNSSTTIAVLVERPVNNPVTFDRTDTTYDCGPWEPDPNEPWPLYYTDAPCDLGPNTQVITSEPVYMAWLDAAGDCDWARWGDPEKPTEPGVGGSGTNGGAPGEDPAPPPYNEDPTELPEIDPAPVPPSLWGIDVDFTTHAVIVLRADVQNRWGGGVWLTDIEEQPGGGTQITYTVINPSGECPVIEGGETVQPTVAIRVPLPLNGPITWVKQTETIGCNWEDIPIGGGGEVPPEPRPL
ncbi:MAG TPA: hypothetical protein VEI97_06015 [bacterium]|nr:hypothetical protein [bacterium]